MKISNQMAKPFITQLHYAKRMPRISHAFGLFENDFLIGVCAFGSPSSPTIAPNLIEKPFQKDVLELSRLVLLPEKNGKNYASFLISRALKKLKNKIIISYADTSKGHIGYVYQASNFLYLGLTKKAIDVCYPGWHPRNNRADLPQQRINRSQKHRYVYITYRNKKEVMKHLKHEILPYPKK